MPIILQARAKVNLLLDVLGRREDGYHELSTVMQSVALNDTLEFRPAACLRVTVDHPDLPAGTANLAGRAAAALAAACGRNCGADIRITKRIPVAAGLGGGSADAAAALVGLNTLWRLGLSLDELQQVAAEVGSDVPFCLSGGTALATGRGEILTQLAPLPDWWVMLVKPPFAVSTAEVYRNFRPAAVSFHPDTEGMLAAVDRRDRAGVAVSMANVLETVTMAAYPVLGEIKRQLLRVGAEACLMSGSGPTVFALFADGQAAARAYEQRAGFAGDVYLTQMADNGVIQV